MECSLRAKNKHEEFTAAIDEYCKQGHAEPVPTTDLNKSFNVVFYLPMQAVYKTSNTTTQLRVAFNASEKTSTGVASNNHRRFKPFVGNRVAEVIGLVTPSRWQHVYGATNSADCASKGSYPSELGKQMIWRREPDWLKSTKEAWPSSSTLIDCPVPGEKRHNTPLFGYLTTAELVMAEQRWVATSQHSAFPDVMATLRKGGELTGSPLLSLHPCLNSRPLTPLPDAEDGMEVRTPGHFLVGGPLEAIPDQSSLVRPLSLLRRWLLCQTLVRHFWQRWSDQYLGQMQRFPKWNRPSRNLGVGDIVCVRGEQTSPVKWPLARVVKVNVGNDGKVRVVTIQTSKGTYKRPIIKLVPLLQVAQGPQGSSD